MGLADDLKEIIKGVSDVRSAEQGLRAGTAQRGASDNQVDLKVDLTLDIFFIGDTHIRYHTNDCPGGWCTTMFVWGPDRFEDPLDLGFELRSGQPYDISSFEWPFGFRDPHQDEESDDDDD